MRIETSTDYLRGVLYTLITDGEPGVAIIKTINQQALLEMVNNIYRLTLINNEVMKADRDFLDALKPIADRGGCTNEIRSKIDLSIEAINKWDVMNDPFYQLHKNMPSFKPGQGNAARIEMMELAPTMHKPHFEVHLDPKRQTEVYTYYQGWDFERFDIETLCQRINKILDDKKKAYLLIGSNEWYFLKSTEPLILSTFLKERISDTLNKKSLTIDKMREELPNTRFDEPLEALKGRLKNYDSTHIQVVNKEHSPHIDIPMFLLTDFLPFKSVDITEISTLLGVDGKPVARLYYQERDRNAPTNHTTPNAIS